MKPGQKTLFLRTWNVF